MEVRLNSVEYSEALYKTLRIMNELENDSLKDQNFLNWIYRNFMQQYKTMSKDNFLKYVHNFVNTFLYYIDDLFDETIISPRIIINKNFRRGDCDDFALLTKTILHYFNIDSKYVLFSQTWGNFTHIANIVDLNNKKYYLDTVSKIYNVFPVNRYKYYKVF